jgi:DNA-binding Xre family transcriptional regulator
MSSVNTGLSITRALELKGRSQKWLAMTIGMAPNAVSRMTRNRSARLFDIVCICTALEMRVSEFIALGETSNEA